MTREISDIHGYHAHVYFDAESAGTARALRADIESRFGAAIDMGHFHEGPIGPHPRASYQVGFPAERFAEVIPWLALNRRGLTVFVHAETGDALQDHTAHVLWLGGSEALKLDIFKRG